MVFVLGCGGEDSGPDFEAQVDAKLLESVDSTDVMVYEPPHTIDKCLRGSWSLRLRDNGYKGSGDFSAFVGNRCADPVLIYTLRQGGSGMGSIEVQTSAGMATWGLDAGYEVPVWYANQMQPGEVLSVGGGIYPSKLVFEDMAPLGQIKIE